MVLKDSFEDLILSHVSKSIQLRSDEEKLFLSLLKRQNYGKREEILGIGELCREQNFVVAGCLKVYYLDEQGEEHIAKFAVEGWWAFDIESFFQLTPAYYGIACLEDTVVWQLTHPGYERLVREVPAFERFYRLMFQHSFIALQHRMTQSLSLTAEERYGRFLQKYPGLESRISQRSVASYLGITPVFLSMLKKEQLENH